MTNKTQAAYDYVRRGSNIGGRIGGAAGALFGGLIGGLPKTQIDNDGNTVQFNTSQRIAKGLLGAYGFGVGGRVLGENIGAFRNAYKVAKGFDPMAAAAIKSRPTWLKNAKTKAEAKRAYHEQARKMHPDLRGGDHSHMSNLNAEWALHEPLFKNAMFSAFQNELEKIAMVGAILGGAAGYKLGPNTLKGKAVGTLIGAGLGHGTEAIGRLAKRKLVDEHHEREMRELYGYQPAAGYTPSF